MDSDMIHVIIWANFENSMLSEKKSQNTILYDSFIANV